MGQSLGSCSRVLEIFTFPSEDDDRGHYASIPEPSYALTGGFGKNGHDGQQGESFSMARSSNRQSREIQKRIRSANEVKRDLEHQICQTEKKITEIMKKASKKKEKNDLLIAFKGVQLNTKHLSKLKAQLKNIRQFILGLETFEYKQLNTETEEKVTSMITEGTRKFNIGFNKKTYEAERDAIRADIGLQMWMEDLGGETEEGDITELSADEQEKFNQFFEQIKQQQQQTAPLAANPEENRQELSDLFNEIPPLKKQPPRDHEEEEVRSRSPRPPDDEVSVVQRQISLLNC